MTVLTSSDPSTYRNQRAISSIATWLEAKSTTLWSTFDISDVDGRERAASWFWQELRGFMEHGESEVAEGNGGTPQPERAPLSSLFVGTGEYVVIHGGTFGPFLNADVAAMWASDAFGRGSWRVVKVEQPWHVPLGERKS